MKNLKNIFLITFAASILISCSKDFLNPEAPGTVLEVNYYKNETEAYAGLVATYDILSKHSGGFENTITMFNAGSDDCTGGGAAANNDPINNFSNYSISPTNVVGSMWSNYYQGIFRANTLLVKLPDVPMEAAKKARFTAEAKMLRAYYHFELLRIFKNIPMFTRPSTPADVSTKLQENPNTVYTQIENDLLDAIPNLPLKIVNLSDEAGRFTQGAAKALLGKVYLYQGNKTAAAAQFADVNGAVLGGANIYGYKLVPSFASLFTTTNKFNSESIIEICHTSASNSGYGNWGSGNDEGNAVCIMVGPRDYTRIGTLAPDFSFGFSFNPVTQDLYNFMQTDPRFSATIADVKSLETAGRVTYTKGFENTGYFIKKFIPLKSDISTGSGNVELNNRQNAYAIRLADTYLMEAEALNATGPRAQALLNAVRARVGLGSVAVSPIAIENERRMELACEGHRWFDLVRSGKAATVLASRNFVAGKHEIWPIPYRETLNTLIVQNPNY